MSLHLCKVNFKKPNLINTKKNISDDNSSGRASTRGSIRRPEGHLTAAHFARSCSLGVPRASSTNPSSLGQESGFQSSTSLNSLGGGQQQRSSLRGRREQSPLTSQPPVGLLGNQVNYRLTVVQLQKIWKFPMQFVVAMI